MPMGARCAPAFFQRVAEFLASPLGQNPDIKVSGFSDSESILSYMDDITIRTNGTDQHHIGVLLWFLDKIIHHGFTLNLKQCQFLRTSAKLLGHIVGRMGVSPTPDYVLKVADFRNFRTVKDVQTWLGLSGFYRGYLRNYAQRTVAMSRRLEVCRLDKNLTELGDAWNEACEAEREDICKSLQCTKCGLLAHPRFDREFIFACDGCMCPGGVGGCLEQRPDDGTIRPVGYASRALTATQLK
jgi:hypothetical protein